jgi:anti-sigma28 factor (negative regulator of flagellin synthesis)
MRVNDSNLNPVTSGTHETAQTNAVGGSRGSGRTAKGSDGGDHVHLSLGAQFHELAFNSPERQSRIENIAAAYANGSYQPDSRAVSERIVSDAFGPR